MRHFNTTATTIGQGHVTIETESEWITGIMIHFDTQGEVIQQFERTFTSDCSDADIVAHLVREANAS